MSTQWMCERLIMLQSVGTSLLAKLGHLRGVVHEATMGPDCKLMLARDAAKITALLLKKWPEHPRILNLDKADKPGWDVLKDRSSRMVELLEPWYLMFCDMVHFHEQTVKVLGDIAVSVMELSLLKNPDVCTGFMNLICLLARVHLVTDGVPRKLMLQLYALSRFASGLEDHVDHLTVNAFADKYAAPIPALQQELKSCSAHIGEVLLGTVYRAVTSYSKMDKLFRDGLLSPLGAPGQGAQAVVQQAPDMEVMAIISLMPSFIDWAMFGFLLCPDELRRPNAVPLLRMVLSDNIVTQMCRDESACLHEDYAAHVHEQLEAMAKEMKEADKKKPGEEKLAYKKVKHVLRESHEVAMKECGRAHRETRLLLRQLLQQQLLLFTNQPGLIGPKLQMIFATLALASQEVLWYARHHEMNVAKSKSKALSSSTPSAQDFTDPSAIALVGAIISLRQLVLKYATAIKRLSLANIRASVERVLRPFLKARDASLQQLGRNDNTVGGVLAQVVEALDVLAAASERGQLDVDVDLQGLRLNWFRMTLQLTNAKTMQSLPPLQVLAETRPPGDRGGTGTGGSSLVDGVDHSPLLVEMNRVVQWSKSIDDLEGELKRHSALKGLYFYRQTRQSMIELAVASSDNSLVPHCASFLHIHAEYPDVMSASTGDQNGVLARAVDKDPALLLGHLAALVARELDDMVAAKSPAINTCTPRLEALVASLNQTEPVVVWKAVFVPREHLRSALQAWFTSRVKEALVDTRGTVTPPVDAERAVRRLVAALQAVEEIANMDLPGMVRQVLLSQAFPGHVDQLRVAGADAVPAVAPTVAKGPLAETVVNWYMDVLVKDTLHWAPLYSPGTQEITSERTAPGAGASVKAHFYASGKQLAALLRIFGAYFAWALDARLQAHLRQHVAGFQSALKSQAPVLRELSKCLLNENARNDCLRRIANLDDLLSRAVSFGQCLVLRELLAHALGEVLADHTPSLRSALANAAQCVRGPPAMSEDLMALHQVSHACGIPVPLPGDAALTRLMLDARKEGDAGADTGVWDLAPYLFAATFASPLWRGSEFQTQTAGLNNNLHCLAVTVHALILAARHATAGQSGSGVAPGDKLRAEVEAELSKFVAAASALVLRSSGGVAGRPPGGSTAKGGAEHRVLAAKLIVLDQLCDLSPYLPRSLLESYVPYTLLRSVYQAEYGGGRGTDRRPTRESVEPVATSDK
eukprot:jgi/Mesvir1/24575/Mv21905-RA.1